MKKGKAQLEKVMEGEVLVNHKEMKDRKMDGLTFVKS